MRRVALTHPGPVARANTWCFPGFLLFTPSSVYSIRDDSNRHVGQAPSELSR